MNKHTVIDLLNQAADDLRRNGQPEQAYIMAKQAHRMAQGKRDEDALQGPAATRQSDTDYHRETCGK